MKLRLVMADPAGNRTALVLTPVPAEARGPLAGRLMALPELRAEQVGYCCPPRTGEALGRLEMMGGEFCGNAARSFGLLLARERVGGRSAAVVEVSGCPRPLTVAADPAGNTAACPMPLPAGIGELAVPALSARPLPAVRMPGITHIIVPGVAADGEAFAAIRRAASRRWRWEALGAMFLGEDGAAMTPVVAVRASGTTVFESSCASGTAAAAAWLSRAREDGAQEYAIRQPGGVIAARVVRAGGALAGITVDGPVVLEPPQEVEVEEP